MKEKDDLDEHVNEPKACSVCGSKLVKIFLKRDKVPVHQNMVFKDFISATSIAQGKLRYAYCKQCGFVYNSAFESSLIDYNENYDNTQSHSHTFDNYMSELAQYLIVNKGIQNNKIVEIGCGKGLFLRKLIEMGKGNTGFGFDPTYDGPIVDLDNRLHFRKCYYGSDCSDISADVIVCRHVIEHIPNPLEFLHTIKSALENSPNAKVFFETPSVEWILQNQVIWDFTYEHCSYFSVKSIQTLFETAGFNVEGVKLTFGDQYLWLEASLSKANECTSNKSASSILQLAELYSRAENNLKMKWSKKIHELSLKGNVALWGAAGKGVTFANLIDPERNLISCLVDVNPRKHDCYIPGTGHIVISPHKLDSYNIKTAIVLNPNYYDEITNQLHDLNLKIELIDLMKIK